jgi:hypothetical protein
MNEQPWWREELRALREHDRAQAPSFQSLLSRRSSRVAAGTWLVRIGVTAAIAAVLLGLPRWLPTDDAELHVSAWRSPTGALLRLEMIPSTSPTASLARPIN